MTVKFHGANLFFRVHIRHRIIEERERDAVKEISAMITAASSSHHILRWEWQNGHAGGAVCQRAVPAWLAADYLFGKEDWDGGSGGRNESTCLFIQPDVPFK